MASPYEKFLRAAYPVLARQRTELHCVTAPECRSETAGGEAVLAGPDRCEPPADHCGDRPNRLR